MQAESGSGQGRFCGWGGTGAGRVAGGVTGVGPGQALVAGAGANDAGRAGMALNA